MKLDALENEFKAMQLPQSIILSKGIEITDVPKFIQSHISYLRNNSGNVAYMPYFTRLQQVYFKLNGKEPKR
jgi:hypothetical protein